MAFIDEVKKQVSLKDIIESRVALTPVGNGKYKGLSPFKEEKTPSFSVDDVNKIWRCFSTKKGGGVLHWFVEAEGMTMAEAARYISQQYGIELDKKEEDHNSKLRNCLKAAQTFYRQGREKALEYVRSREYPESIVDKYEMGYSSDSYTDIITYLRSEGFDNNTIVLSGVASWDKNHKDRIYSRQRDRVIIPLKDKYGAVIGFIGRAVGDAKPKYLNPTVSPLYKTTTTLFGFDKARPIIKESGKVSVVEGPFDAIMGIESGVGTVSVLGSSVSDEQLRVLSGIAKDIYLVFDSDKAGIDALLSTFKTLEESGTDVITYAVSLPEGMDVADFVQKKGIEEFRMLMENAVPDNSVVIQALYEEARKTSTKDSAIARKVLEGVKPYFKETQYTYRTLDMLDRLSQLLNLDKAKLDKWMQSGTEFTHNSTVYKKIEGITFPATIYERRIMTECLRDPDNIPRLKTMGITRYDFESHLVAQVLALTAANPESRFEALQDNLSQEDYDTVMSAYMNAEKTVFDIYSLGGIIVANKAKAKGAALAVTNILGRPRTNVQREVAPTYQEMLRRMQNGHK